MASISYIIETNTREALEETGGVNKYEVSKKVPEEVANTITKFEKTELGLLIKKAVADNVKEAVGNERANELGYNIAMKVIEYLYN